MEKGTKGQMGKWRNEEIEEWTSGGIKKGENGQMDKWRNGQMEEWTNARNRTLYLKFICN
jgi:hypothetical protein